MDPMRIFLSASICCWLLFGHVRCFSTATFSSNPTALADACNDRNPSGHGVAPQTGASPYKLVTSGSTYSEGSTVTLTLSSNQAETFKGFLVQGVVEGTNTRVGDFTAGTDSKLNCQGAGDKTITHNGPGDKTSVTFKWTAPNSDEGNIVFMFTIVQVRVTYWMNLKSSALTYEASTGTASPTTPTPAPTTRVTAPPLPADAVIDVTTCGVTKSCFRLPVGCASDCATVVTWSRTPLGYLRFELGTQTSRTDDQYLAVGFSKDGAMGDDSATYCASTPSDTVNPSDVRMSFNYNTPSKFSQPLTDMYLGLIQAESEVTISDGWIQCRFTRRVSVEGLTSAELDKVFDLGASAYNLMVASGGLNGGSLSYHNARLVSGEAFNFTSAPVDGGGSAGFPMVKAHGIIMIFAWMVSASFAILMPRYNKNSWPNKKWCGKPVWFQLHLPLMLCTFFLTVAGFVIIFVSVEGYARYPNLPDKAHPIMGIIVTALAVINPLMAACRPHPGTPKRPVFNWMHFLVGEFAHIGSIATIFLAMYMPKAGAPWWGKWIMVAFIAWHTLIEIILAIHTNCCMKKQKPDTKYEMSDIGQQPGTESPEKQSSTAKTFFVVLHLLGVLGLATALSIGIGMG